MHWSLQSGEYHCPQHQCSGEMVMPKARIKDIEMYYEVHGTGTPLVHIGGLAGDARAWARQIEHLSKHYQVICFDNRGTGRTSCPDMPYSIRMFASLSLTASGRDLLRTS